MPPTPRGIGLLRTCVMALLAAVAALLAVARPAAHAAPDELSIMMDDNQLLYSGDQARDDALASMQQLGVDEVRVTVLWSAVARGGRRGAGAADPSAYPAGNWDPYDRLVQACQRLGITVYLDVTGPGPPWAMGRTGESAVARSFRPHPRSFGRFVAAVGTRYSGLYRDEDDGHQILPRVGVWSLWNEPNQPGWLSPQHVRTAHGSLDWSPIAYRELYLEGLSALARTGHGSDTVYAGETAPLGSPGRGARSPIAAAPFIRELFCISPGGRPYRGWQARERRCRELRRPGGFRMSAWAHHPYTKTQDPRRPQQLPGAITMANIGALPGLLDAVARRTHLFAAGLPVVLSEYGYESDPPDPYNGVSPDDQAAYLNEGERIAYQQDRVMGLAQYLLRDAPPVRLAPRGSRPYWFTYQSGLFFADGTPKPAADAYALPFTVDPAAPAGGRPQVAVWGQLRFRRLARLGMRGAPLGDRVILQFLPAAGSRWQSQATLAVDGEGSYFQATVPSRGVGTWRAIWKPRNGPPQVSREVPVGG